VDEIREGPTIVPLADNFNPWIPASVSIPNAHQLRGGGASGILFRCDGQRITSLGVQAADPQGCVFFKEYSVYYNQGFWILAADATRISNDEHWGKLYFDHEDDYSSYLTNAGENLTLACQRQDQRWPRMLLPNIYHGPNTPFQQYGGLCGELPIFLALMAFSIQRDHVNWWLQNSFVNGQWRTHHYGPGCEYLAFFSENQGLTACLGEYQRGVRVKVWVAPDSVNELQAYELGQLGKYFN
jgi:hypothetical protein